MVAPKTPATAEAKRALSETPIRVPRTRGIQGPDSRGISAKTVVTSREKTREDGVTMGMRESCVIITTTSTKNLDGSGLEQSSKSGNRVRAKKDSVAGAPETSFPSFLGGQQTEKNANGLLADAPSSAPMQIFIERQFSTNNNRCWHSIDEWILSSLACF